MRLSLLFIICLITVFNSNSQERPWLTSSQQIALVSGPNQQEAGCILTLGRMIDTVNQIQYRPLIDIPCKTKFQYIPSRFPGGSSFGNMYAISHDTIDEEFLNPYIKRGARIAFVNSHFKNRVSIAGDVTTEFADAFFYKSRFDSSFELLTCLFPGSVNFEDCIFLGDLSFWSTIFGNGLYFHNATFNSTIDFSFSSLGGPFVSFSNLHLGDYALFRFRNTSLPDTIDFSYNGNIIQEIDLSTAFYGDDRIHYINLYKSDITKFHLDYGHFQLLLYDPATGRKLSNDEANSIYESLLKNFKERGQLESFKLLNIEYLEFNDNSRFKHWSKISKWWWNFGYEHERVFSHTVLIFFIFSLMTFMSISALNKEKDGVYYLKNIPEVYRFKSPSYYLQEIRKTPPTQLLKKIPLRELIIRLWYSCLYTAVIFFLFSLKIDNFNLRKLGVWHILGLLYIITVYTIGIVCIAYMAGYVLSR